MHYNDTFAPVVRMETIRILLALAVQENWEIQQMDVKGAYLNGTLKEKIYMNQPEGYDDGIGNLCYLIKSLYGLKQAKREWNHELNKQLEKQGWKAFIVDPCMYYRRAADGIEILTIWVDDLLCFASHEALMQWLKRDLHDIFDITDLGAPTKIVGLKIDHNKEN